MHKTELPPIGHNIEMIRKSRGATLELVSSQIGRTPQWLNNIEKNRRSITSADLYLIARVLEAEIEWFFKENLNGMFNKPEI